MNQNRIPISINLSISDENLNPKQMEGKKLSEKFIKVRDYNNLKNKQQRKKFFIYLGSLSITKNKSKFN